MQELNAPIPGSSLTSTPKGGPHERPPQFTDPEDALQLHLANLSRPDVLESVFDALDMGIDIVTLTEGILRSGVAAGRHTIDTSIIIGPVVHEFIKSNAKAAGVEFEEGLQATSNKDAKLAKKISMTDRTIASMQDIEEISGEEVTPEPKRAGIIERRL